MKKTPESFVGKNSSKIKILNILSLTLLFLVLCFHVFSINNLVGNNYQTKRLYRQLEALKAEIGELEAQVANFRQPSAIKKEVHEQMIAAGNITFLRIKQEEVAFAEKRVRK